MISEVAAAWHELMIPRCTLFWSCCLIRTASSWACDAACSHTTTPISRTRRTDGFITDLGMLSTVGDCCCCRCTRVVP